MIACDNDSCSIKWFIYSAWNWHLGIGIARNPLQVRARIRNTDQFISVLTSICHLLFLIISVLLMIFSILHQHNQLQINVPLQDILCHMSQRCINKKFGMWYSMIFFNRRSADWSNAWGHMAPTPVKGLINYFFWEWLNLWIMKLKVYKHPH